MPSESEDVELGFEEIKDAEDYVHQRRLKSIFDLREELHTKRKQIRIAEADDQNRFAALCVYRSIVDSYVLELEPLLRLYERGIQYLTETNFGTVSITPETRQAARAGDSRGQVTQVYDPDKEEWLTVSHSVEPTTYQLQGLESLLTLPNPIETEFTIKTDRPLGDDLVTITATSQIGMDRLDAMVRVMNTFLSDIGFEVDPEPEDDPAHLSL